MSRYFVGQGLDSTSGTYRSFIIRQMQYMKLFGFAPLINGFIGSSVVGRTIIKLLEVIVDSTDLKINPIFSTIEFVSNFN